MASFSHTISVPKAPGEVFPWLLEEDKVPQWTTRLQAMVGDVNLHPDYGRDGDALYGIPINSVPAGQPLVEVRSKEA